MVDREKDKIHGEEVVELLGMSLAGRDPQSESAGDRAHMSKQVIKFTQQLQDR